MDETEKNVTVSIIEKLHFIKSDKVPKTGAKIKTEGTSIKITHSCGCLWVQHFAAKEPLSANRNDPVRAAKLRVKRSNWIEFCPEHQKAFEEFINQFKQIQTT